MLLLIDADIGGSGGGCVVIGIPCGDVWRVWEKDAEKQRSDLIFFLIIAV